MKLKSQMLKRMAGLGITTASRLWMSTMDFQISYYDPTCDVAHPDYRGPSLIAFWHEYILTPVYLRPHSRLSILVSRHEDAEFITQVAHFVGYKVVRGSSNRGGVNALREMFTQGKKMNLAITPDGPRGPRRHFAQGAIFLASKLGLPLMLFGFGHDRPWRTPTWDHFAVPRPYTRCRIIASPKIYIPAKLDRDGLEHYRQEMENLLNHLTDEAEDWAVSGDRYEGQQQIVMKSAARCRLDRTVLGEEKESSGPDANNSGDADNDDDLPSLKLTA